MTNNVSNIKQLQSVNPGAPKFIQLQSSSNKPILSSANVTLVTPQSLGAASVVQAQSVNSTTKPAGNLLFQQTQNGQIVVMNGTQFRVVPSSAAVQSTVINKVTPAHSSGQTMTIAGQTSTSNRVLTATPVGMTAVSQPDVKTKPITLSSEDQTNVTKCRNFLTTLIKLAAKDGFAETQKQVKMLVQKLIDDKVTPQVFTTKLQQLLNSNPQPYLVPFLTKSLPLLRLSMCQQNNKLGEVPITIAEGAMKVSTNPDNIAKQTIAQKNKIITKPKTVTKPRPNNVPDIRLPRAAPFRQTSILTATPQQTAASYSLQQHQQQVPHPSSVTGASNSVLTTPVRTLHTTKTTANRYTASFTSPNNNAAIGGGGGSYKDDDDINDVASMAGVNLSEENARILATTELVGSQTRSCEDVTCVNQKVLQRLMTTMASKTTGIQHIHADAVKYLACAMEQRVKDLTEKLASVVTHRHHNFKEDSHLKAVSDVKSQLKFLQELDQIEKKRRDEAEREVLMKAIKSRSKNDNPEQLRLKERAKKVHQEEQDKILLRNADQTALNAIGTRRKRPKFDSSTSKLDGMPLSSNSRKITRPRMKRATLRDFIFVMENEKGYRKSKAIFKSYIK